MVESRTRKVPEKQVRIENSNLYYFLRNSHPSFEG